MPHSWHVAAINVRLSFSKQQKTELSRSLSQHGSGVVVGAEVGATVVTVGALVGEVVVTVGALVGAVGADVGLVVGQSVPRAVPVVPYVDPVLRGTTGPHSPALPTIFLHRRTQLSVRSESKPSQRPG